MDIKELNTDVLIIGGGTAGCFAAYQLAKLSDLKVIIAEKANINRSGCLAAGVNALNAYITEGRTPQDYVDYCLHDADGIAREDLLLSLSERLNEVTKEMEDLGLVILKDSEGKYVTRGNRNIKINGENFKLLLAKAVEEYKSKIFVINHVNITDLKLSESIVNNKSLKYATGAYGFSVNDNVYYDISAKYVIVATGGAAGLYRPNNPGFSRHKIWYSPFNTGAGYAFGLKAGAEMTTFEMRFIALRCKDTIAPTGTIAQGVGAKQVNSLGEIYEQKYGLTTSQRLYGTVSENLAGKGPCYLKTDTISDNQQEELYKAYLNMAPSQTLKWLESKNGPKVKNVEIEGTEPYIVGGHTASGYWIDNNRETTIKGLYAVGDVAGGAPQKYVTGALAEGKIAAEAIINNFKNLNSDSNRISSSPIEITSKAKIFDNYSKYFSQDSIFSIEDIEEAMQKIMDQYAGGISTHYKYNESSLKIASEQIKSLQNLVNKLHADDTDDLLRIYEVSDRLLVCLAVIAHLEARKETRWHCFAENADYPEKNTEFELYINSVLENGFVKIIKRDLVRGGKKYEHNN
ncbi:MAG: adenylyl-sulfate reductase subunit alpha [Succinivibrionaceae bacterium]